eukprot:1156665-Pelagomonas_calceolata.AAC.7
MVANTGQSWHRGMQKHRTRKGPAGKLLPFDPCGSDDAPASCLWLCYAFWPSMPCGWNAQGACQGALQVAPT